VFVSQLQAGQQRALFCMHGFCQVELPRLIDCLVPRWKIQ